MKRILIAGCGYLGEATARFFQCSGWQVAGLTASESTAAALVGRGVPAMACDFTDAEALAQIYGSLPSPAFWIHCASTKGGDAEAYRRVYLGGLRSLLKCFPGCPGIFVSSTSVYSQIDGEEVDELSPADPHRETGRVLLECEDLALESGSGAVRLAGLYGPGRSVLLRKFLDGSARIEGDGARWINQIHRCDAARALFHLMESGRFGGGLFNVTDNTPLRQIDIYNTLARLLQKPVPPTAPPDPNRKRGLTSKRVLNHSLRSTGWAPEFPDFFSALRSGADGGASIAPGSTGGDQ